MKSKKSTLTQEALDQLLMFADPEVIFEDLDFIVHEFAAFVLQSKEYSFPLPKHGDALNTLKHLKYFFKEIKKIEELEKEESLIKTT